MVGCDPCSHLHISHFSTEELKGQLLSPMEASSKRSRCPSVLNCGTFWLPFSPFGQIGLRGFPVHANGGGGVSGMLSVGCSMWDALHRMPNVGCSTWDALRGMLNVGCSNHPGLAVNQSTCTKWPQAQAEKALSCGQRAIKLLLGGQPAPSTHMGLFAVIQPHKAAANLDLFAQGNLLSAGWLRVKGAVGCSLANIASPTAC